MTSHLMALAHVFILLLAISQLTTGIDEGGRTQVGEERQEAFRQRQARMRAAEGVLGGVRMTAAAWKRTGIAIGDAGGWHTAAELLARQDLTLQQVRSMPQRVPERSHVPGKTCGCGCGPVRAKHEKGPGAELHPRQTLVLLQACCRSPVRLSTPLARAW